MTATKQKKKQNIMATCVEGMIKGNLVAFFNASDGICWADRQDEAMKERNY